MLRLHRKHLTHLAEGEKPCILWSPATFCKLGWGKWVSVGGRRRVMLFSLVVMATLGRQGCRSSLSGSPGAPVPLRGAVFLSAETWTSKKSQG